MATIKSFTDLSQSKTLSKILPMESADMYYNSGDECDIYFGSGIYKEIADWICKGTPRPADIPCWSLTRLLSVLPYCPDLSKQTDGKWYITTYPNDVHTCLMAYDNPVDACVAMIIKLNELKML